MRRPNRGGSRGLKGSVPAAVGTFVIGSLVALIVVGIAATLLVRRIGTTQAIDEAKDLTSVVARGVVEPSLTNGIAQSDPQAISALDRTVKDRVITPPIVRVKIWDADGRIVYSDDPRLIGLRYPLGADELHTLRTGTVDAGVSDLSAPENRYERGYDKLLEVYRPVRTPDGRTLLFEAYLRFANVSQDAQRVWTLFLPALLLALLVLWAVQVPLAWMLARRVQEGQRDRERLLRRAIESSDAERRRIASDVHDGVVQDLAGLSYSLTATADRVGKDGSTEEASSTLRQAAASVRRSMRELRTLLVEIHPPNLHSAGLAAALSDLLAPLAARGIETTLDVAPDLILPEDVEALVFRGAQEALRNVLTHASARSVTVTVDAGSGAAVLEVSDDGRGFDIEGLTSRRAEGHLGLGLLSELARDAGGHVEIRSGEGTGTTIRMEVPLP
jgi:signal transduction histidine kinase